MNKAIQVQPQNQIIRPSRLDYRAKRLQHRTTVIQVTIPEQRQPAPENQHPDTPLVISALAKRGIQGEVVQVSNRKPTCDEWHQVHAVELGYYHYDRRWVFALVKIGG